MRVSPSGSLWTCDGHSIMKLDDAGKVVRILGAKPDATQLGKIAAITIDKHGKIYAADSRTGAIHVFEKDGTARHICQTLPSDVSKELWNPTLAVNDTGNVYICIGKYTGEKYLHFSPNGKRMGQVRFRTDKWSFQPETGNGLAVDHRVAFLIDKDDQVLQTINRSHDENWLELVGDVAFAPDGSFVIAAMQASSNGNSITVYDKTARPKKTLKLPNDTNFPNLAFDGTNLVVGSFDAITYVNINDGQFNQFTPKSDVGKQTSWHPFFVPGIDEVIVFDGASSTLRRYEIPDK